MLTFFISWDGYAVSFACRGQSTELSITIVRQTKDEMKGRENLIALLYRDQKAHVHTPYVSTLLLRIQV